MSIIFNVAMADHQIPCRSDKKINFLEIPVILHFFSSVSSNAELVQFIKAFWVDFVKSISEIQHGGGSKMADQMSLFDVV